jgi:hypothetical protein
MLLLLVSIDFLPLAFKCYEIQKITITGNHTFGTSELLKKTTLIPQLDKEKCIQKEPAVLTRNLETDLKE